jgi:hypothetical protein
MKTLLATFGSLLAFVAPATASVTYEFNRYFSGTGVNRVYVHEAVIQKTKTGVTISAKVDLPRCDSHSSLTGSIGFTFKDGNGGYVYSLDYLNNIETKGEYQFPVDYLEGFKNVQAEVFAPQEVSEYGLLVIFDNTFCEPLDYNK